MGLSGAQAVSAPGGAVRAPVSLLSLIQPIGWGTSGLGVCIRARVRGFEGPPTPSILLASCRGNVRGRRPYEEGTPCSQCPSGYRCENSLCGESGMGWRGRGGGGKVEPLSSAWTGEGPSGMRPPGEPRQARPVRVAKPALPSLRSHLDSLSFQVN